MVKRLKTNHDDHSDQQPFQQQQLQQQQQHQQQQQQTLRAPGTQHNLNENANTLLGASGNSSLFGESLPPNYNSNLQSSSQNTSQFQPTYTNQPATVPHHQPPAYPHPSSGYLSSPNISAPVSYSGSSNFLTSHSSNNFSSAKPSQYGLNPPVQVQQNMPPNPNPTHNSIPTYYSNQLLQTAINQPTTPYENPSSSSTHLGSSQGGGSVAIYKPPAGGAPTNHRGDMLLGPPQVGVCSNESQWPVPKSCIGNEVCEDPLDQIIQGIFKDPPKGPPVAQFPQRNSFLGIYGLKVSFPGESPKLVLREDTEGNKHLFTELDHCITTVVRHSADQSAAMRFLIVYSRDSETTQPVHPCKNHQNVEHPNHMLEVKSGSSTPTWWDDPHPSVVVAPCPSSEGKYSVQVKFLCRNSCLTRKNLTLICQLEREGQVVGRECLELKISACPRRDAKMLKNSRDQQEVDAVDGEHIENRPMGLSDGQLAPNAHVLVRSATLPAVLQAPSQSLGDALSSALESGRKAAYLAFIDKKFQDMHHEDYTKLKEEFDCWWDSKSSD